MSNRLCGISLPEVRERLLTGLLPDGFNIGVNEGLAAGQTVEHAHVHIIPRRKGDVPDPRGGIRWIIEEKANYWNEYLPPPSPAGADPVPHQCATAAG
jgi:diadenosine tetraphosphate (Ap4A) HIT family hydrolase